MISTEKYIIKAKIGKGVSTYQFDNRQYAVEIAEQLAEDGVKFEANFDWRSAECQTQENE